MHRYYIDHLYNYIEIDSETGHIIDIPSIKKELERLKNINQLGVITKFYPLAKHSKFEHSLGLYHLCKLVEEYQHAALNRANIQKKNLKIAAMLHGIGHLPFTYATEKAFILLYKINKNIKNDIDTIINEVSEFLRYSKRSKKVIDFKKFLKYSNHYELHRWLSAYKILKMDDFPDNQRGQVIRYIVDSDKEGYRLLRELDKIDFTLRDAYYINLFNIQLNLVPFFKNMIILKNGHIEDRYIIKSFYDTLKEKVYNDHRVKALENLFSRIIVQYILDNDLNIFKFLKIDDKELENQIKPFKYKIINDEYSLDDLVRKIEDKTIELVYYSKYYTNETDIIELERKIVRKRGYRTISYPETKGIFLSITKSPEDYSIYFLTGKRYFEYDVKLYWHSRSKDPKFVLSAICEIEKGISFYELSSYKEHKEKIFSFIFGKKTESKFKSENYIIKDLHSIVKIDIDRLPDIFSNKFDYLVKEIQMILKLPFPSDLDIEENLREDIIKFLLYSPEIFSLNFLRNIKTDLGKIRHHGKIKEALNEYKSFLNTVIEELGRNEHSWTLPCVNIYEENNERFGEIDILTLRFKNEESKPVLTLEEVSVTDSAKKRMDTRTKFGKIKNMIEHRFPRKIKINFKFNGENFEIR